MTGKPPGRPPLLKVRSRRKEARPGEILEAGFREFAERGFLATRLEDVAARAGVAKGTIYLYYGSKEALFEEAIRT
ncbi:helix-turn-helix domain-containing protein, partial [Enterococcus faecium]